MPLLASHCSYLWSSFADFKNMKLGELRVKLNQLNLPTTGLRTELVARYEHALRLERNKFMSWDSLAQAWVPMPSMKDTPYQAY